MISCAGVRRGKGTVRPRRCVHVVYIGFLRAGPRIPQVPPQSLAQKRTAFPSVAPPPLPQMPKTFPQRQRAPAIFGYSGHPLRIDRAQRAPLRLVYSAHPLRTDPTHLGRSLATCFLCHLHRTTTCENFTEFGRASSAVYHASAKVSDSASSSVCVSPGGRGSWTELEASRHNQPNSGRPLY